MSQHLKAREEQLLSLLSDKNRRDWVYDEDILLCLTNSAGGPHFLGPRGVHDLALSLGLHCDSGHYWGRLETKTEKRQGREEWAPLRH